jgi:CheY-like chemotaxis protein/HPt (histidine-containing phosphotransfer) domain-containing protein
MTELLLDTPLSDPQRGHAETIRSSGEALLTVINDILDFSKIEAGKLTLESTEFDLGILMDEVADLLTPRARQKDIEIVCRVAPGVPGRLVGDPVRVRQILTNLAGNAVKFTDHGSVRLEAQLIGEEEHAATVRVLVRDTGMGIPAEHQADIFDSFTQIEGGNNRRHGGTGLGLAICLKLVDLMGGRIGLESRVGEGSTFWFELVLGKVEENPNMVPRAIDAALPGDTSSSDQGTGLPGKYRVLLAEDNEVNRMVAIGMVERLGYTVEAVRNGREVIAAFDHRRHDLILMDVQMPDMDGFTATAAIRELERGTGRHVPIIAMTAHAMQGDRERCLEAGMDGYISKPVRSAALREALAGCGGMIQPATHAAPEPCPAVFDAFSVEILETCCGHDPALVREVLELVLQELPARLDRLEAAITGRRGHDVAWEAHDLKGLFMTIGAKDLAATCQELMSLGDRDQFGSIEGVYQPMRKHCSRVGSQAQGYLDTISLPVEAASP